MEHTTSNNDPQINREEYISSLHQWLDNARLCIILDYSRQFTLCSGLSNSPYSPRSNPFLDSYRFYQNRQEVLNVNATNPTFLPGTYEFIIPPMWKRFVAEILDFSILFMIKLLLTFIAVETFNFVTVENYGFDTIEKYFQNPRMAMQMSIEILCLEILHRFIVCCYEVYWLRGSSCATPGKRYMGLIVIQVETVAPAPGLIENKVRVNPCSTLGFQHAVTRAVLKNIFVGFMLPVFFTMSIFRFNRTGYDIVSKSLVVEYDPNMHPID
ncbi:hypothetical protein WA026_004557 [Henosepilachna vigintioctopunctata]|uniref:RDD domain-containing protein n=1 Tax=Henosepilachna vigintioctopunctata TaxID=420089 RepID=A0AAW1VAE1_9CUCU